MIRYWGMFLMGTVIQHWFFLVKMLLQTFMPWRKILFCWIISMWMAKLVQMAITGVWGRMPQITLKRTGHRVMEGEGVITRVRQELKQQIIRMAFYGIIVNGME